MDTPLLDRLTQALAASREGAPTRPVSVTLPAPLADAYRLLADRGMIDSVSVAATHALEEGLQALVIGMRLDAIYAEHPEARPTEEEVAAMAETRSDRRRMSVTVVLDGAGLQAWARRVPPRPLLAVMEVLRRQGSGRVLVPSVVTVEALTGGNRNAAVNRALKLVDIDLVDIDERLPLARTLRQRTTASAVDAVVAEAAMRSRAAYVVTSDPDDLGALIQQGGGRAHVVTV